MRVVKKLLAFTNNIMLAINDNNFSSVLQVIYFINLLAPEKKIHLIHDTGFLIPRDFLIYAVDRKRNNVDMNNDSV
jgi:hypothetical protein